MRLCKMVRFGHVCEFLFFFVRFRVFPAKWAAEKPKFVHTRAKMCKQKTLSCNTPFSYAPKFCTSPTILEALGQIRANRVFPPIRIQIRVIRVQSWLLSIFWKVDSQKEGFFFFFEARIGSRESVH